MTTHIASAAQWRQVTAASSIVVTDFYADWCGPCKVIAPTFESLATKYAKPNRITFAKVDVDNNREVAQLYNIRAMPTFVILKNGSVIDTIQGANPQALTAAVEKAVKLAGPGGGAPFQTPGRTLGGPSTSSGDTPTVRIGGGATRPSGNPIQGRTSSWDLNNIINAIMVFVGLYLTSLFTLDPYMAAQNSRFNKANQHTAPIRTASGAPFGGRAFAPTSSASGSKSSGSSSGAAKPQVKPTFRTLADLGE